MLKPYFKRAQIKNVSNNHLNLAKLITINFDKLLYMCVFLNIHNITMLPIQYYTLYIKT